MPRGPQAQGRRAVSDVWGWRFLPDANESLLCCCMSRSQYPVCADIQRDHGRRSPGTSGVGGCFNPMNSRPGSHSDGTLP